MSKTKKRLVISTVLCTAILFVAAIYANILINQGNEIEEENLQTKCYQIDQNFIDKNYYLSVDRSYFYILKGILTNGRVHILDGPDGQASNILNNLERAKSADPSIQAVFVMLDDETAPYVIINGTVREKRLLPNSTWGQIIEKCRRMDGNSYAEWNNYWSANYNKNKIFSIYKKYNSINYDNGEKICGYLVINYFCDPLFNKINSLTNSDETAFFYNLKSGEFYSSEDLNSIAESEAEDIIVSALKTNNLSGVVDLKSEKANRARFNIIKSQYDPIYIMLVKTNIQTMFYHRIIIVFISAIFFVVIILIIVYFMQYKNYLSGLSRIISASGEGQSQEQAQLKKLIVSYSDSTTNINSISRRILDDSKNINKLTSLLYREMKANNEIEMLYGNAQINSHFLLNTLDSIYWNSFKELGPENSQTLMIEELCWILKYALDSSNPYITLREEIECGKAYISIQKARKKESIKTEWDVDENLMDYLVCKLILQPVIENSIQHSVLPQNRDEIFIRISAFVFENDLYISVKDNGIGINEDKCRKMNEEFRETKPVTSKHIGMKNVNRRMQLQFGDKYGLIIRPINEGGTEVIMRLKLMKTSYK